MSGAAQCSLNNGGCGARIRWIKTVAGKNMPVDPEKLIEWVTDEKVLPGSVRITLTNSAGKTDHGWQASVITPGSRQIEGYTSHYATCPKAKAFRR